MKLCTLRVPPSDLRRLAEAVTHAPAPSPGRRSFSYHLLAAALELGVLSEGVLGDLLAAARAGSSPLPDVGNLLWITAPDINTGNDAVEDLVRRAGHLPEGLLQPGPESRGWWQEAFGLFATDPREQQRVIQRLQGEAQALPAGERPDEPPGRRPGEPPGRGPDAGLNKQALGYLKDIVKQHKDTGDKISELIDDLRADLAKRNREGAVRTAQQIIKQGKQPDQGPVTKHTPASDPTHWWEAEDRLLARALREEAMLGRGVEVLNHALVQLSNSGRPVLISPLGRELYEGWRDRLRSWMAGLGGRARHAGAELLGKGKEAWTANRARSRQYQDQLQAGMKGLGKRLLDRAGDPVGTQQRDLEQRRRLSNTMLAKTAITLLANTAYDRIHRLPGWVGQQFLRADRTTQNRQRARVALGLEREQARPDPAATHVSSTNEFGG